MNRVIAATVFLTLSILGSEGVSALEPVEDSARRDELVIGVKHAPPFLIEGKNGRIERGIAHALWIDLAENADLDFRYERIDTLSGLIKALEEGRIDVCINPLTVTSERYSKIDFTQPFYISNLSIATQKESKGQLFLFLRNFLSKDFLRTISLLAFIILIFGALLWLVEKRKNPGMFRKGWRGILDGFWWSAVTMTTVGYGDKAPTTGVGKFIATIWMFTAVIIVSGFTATIASSLTVQKTQHGVDGLQDLARVRTATVQGSNSADFLMDKGIDPIEKPTLEEAIEALGKGRVKAVFYDEPLLRYAIKELGYKKELMVLDHKFEDQYYSFGLPKGSLYEERLNRELLKIIESEDWEDILHRYDL